MMDIISELSSQTGDRTSESNKQAALKCIQHPELLVEIATGLTRPEPKLVSDCAEVLTLMAEESPDLVAPYADQLPPLLGHRRTQSRWEAAHALALVAHLRPEVVAPLLPSLDDMLTGDKSVIVRDYVTDMVGNYGGTSHDAALAAYPLLRDMMTRWEGKQAGHALAGLVKVVDQAPELRDEIVPLAEAALDHPRKVVQRAARRLLRTCAQG